MLPNQALRIPDALRIVLHGYVESVPIIERLKEFSFLALLFGLFEFNDAEIR